MHIVFGIIAEGLSFVKNERLQKLAHRSTGKNAKRMACEFVTAQVLSSYRTLLVIGLPADDAKTAIDLL